MEALCIVSIVLLWLAAAGLALGCERLQPKAGARP